MVQVIQLHLLPEEMTALLMALYLVLCWGLLMDDYLELWLAAPLMTLLVMV